MSTNQNSFKLNCDFNADFFQAEYHKMAKRNIAKQAQILLQLSQKLLSNIDLIPDKYYMAKHCAYVSMLLVQIRTATEELVMQDSAINTEYQQIISSLNGLDLCDFISGK